MAQHRTFALLGVFTLLVATPGCDQEAQTKVMLRKESLIKIAKAYSAYAEQEKRSPSDAEELASFIEASGDDEITKDAVSRIREGDVIVYFDVDLQKLSPSDKYAIAFEPGCLRAGGYMVTPSAELVLVTGKTFQDYKEPAKVEASNTAPSE